MLSPTVSSVAHSCSAKTDTHLLPTHVIGERSKEFIASGSPGINKIKFWWTEAGDLDIKCKHLNFRME